MKKIEIQKDGLHITPLKAIVCQNAQMVKLLLINYIIMLFDWFLFYIPLIRFIHNKFIKICLGYGFYENG